MARDCTARFLLLAGVVDEGDLPAGWIMPLPEQMRVVRVTEPVVAGSKDFRFAQPYTGLEVFEKAGAVIGWSDGKPVTTPYDDCIWYALAAPVTARRNRGAARPNRTTY